MNFIQFLIEKRRGDMSRGDAYDDLMKYFNDAADTYISFTKIEKIGINPNSRYNTPNGIYTYQLDYVFKITDYKDERDLSLLPFAHDQPYIWVVKPKTKVLRLQDYTDADLQQDIKKLKTHFKTDSHEFIIKQFGDTARHAYPASKMWNITRGLAQKNPNKWNHILRVILGYSIIRDDGYGVLHPAEPYQTVFLSFSSLSPVEKIKNRAKNLAAKSNHLERQQRSEPLQELLDDFIKNPSVKIYEKLLQDITHKNIDDFLQFYKVKRFRNSLRKVFDILMEKKEFTLNIRIAVFLHNVNYYKDSIVKAVITNPDILENEYSRLIMTSTNFRRVFKDDHDKVKKMFRIILDKFLIKKYETFMDMGFISEYINDVDFIRDVLKHYNISSSETIFRDFLYLIEEHFEFENDDVYDHLQKIGNKDLIQLFNKKWRDG